MSARALPLALAALAALSTLGGCTSALDVGYPEAVAHPALLASVAPRRIAIGPVTDRRMDQTRIGARPGNGDAIETTRAVTDIVREALVVELTKNGHAVVGDHADLRLVADVEDFWLDTAGRDGKTHYVGRVALAVAVRDEAGGTTLFVRRYAGMKRRYAEADSRDAWREVMETALARTLRDLATDRDLVAAVAGRAMSGVPPSAIRQTTDGECPVAAATHGLTSQMMLRGTSTALAASITFVTKAFSPIIKSAAATSPQTRTGPFL
jgi:hypothetical protein